jgi:hypothetical protein
MKEKNVKTADAANVSVDHEMGHKSYASLRQITGDDWTADHACDVLLLNYLQGQQCFITNPMYPERS